MILCAFIIAALLSQWIIIGGIGLVHKGISNNEFLIQSTFVAAAPRANNSESLVDYVMVVCFLDSQDIEAPFKPEFQSTSL